MTRSFLAYQFLLALLIGWDGLFAQKGALEGQVVLPNGEPVIDAEITLIHTTKGTLTDSSGSYRIEGISYGTYSLQVFAYGYNPEVKKIRIDSAITEVDLRLDTTERKLRSVDVTAERTQRTEQHLKAIEGMGIYAAKKSEVVDPEESGADRSTDKARELFSSVSGVIAHEDGDGGLQMDIGNRGLNPSRSASFLSGRTDRSGQGSRISPVRPPIRGNGQFRATRSPRKRRPSRT
ncbi:MAG: carboxypeptidase regulatory-like domain-containing protein [Flavobacteriales bacterium]